MIRKNHLFFLWKKIIENGRMNYEKNNNNENFESNIDNITYDPNKNYTFSQLERILTNSLTDEIWK